MLSFLYICITKINQNKTKTYDVQLLYFNIITDVNHLHLLFNIKTYYLDL